MAILYLYKGIDIFTSDEMSDHTEVIVEKTESEPLEPLTQSGVDG